MELLKPEMLDDDTSQAEFQKRMVKDIGSAAKKLKGKPCFFAYARDVKISGKKTTLFVVVRNQREAKAWQDALRPRQPKPLLTGTCTVESSGDRKIRVVIDKVSTPKAVVKGAPDAFRMGTQIVKFVEKKSLTDRAESESAASETEE